MDYPGNPSYKLPIKRDYPYGGSWKPRNQQDVDDLGTAMLVGAIENFPLPPWYEKFVPYKDTQQAHILQDLDNTLMDSRYGPMGKGTPAAGSIEYDNMIDNFVQNRINYPAKYQELYREGPAFQNLPYSDFAEIQERTPYPTIIRENIDKATVPLYNFVERAKALPGAMGQSFRNQIVGEPKAPNFGRYITTGEPIPEDVLNEEMYNDYRIGKNGYRRVNWKGLIDPTQLLYPDGPPPEDPYQ